MEYVIFYDANYISEVQKEVGRFVVLGEGIGLINDELFCGKYYIMDKYINFADNLYNRLKFSIFVRHFYEVKFILNDVSELFAIDFDIPKDNEIALHAVYTNEAENCTRMVLDWFSKKGYTNNIKNPDFVISITFADKLYVGCSARAELPTNYKQGMPHFAKRDEVSRAEFKLQEAIEFFNISMAGVKTALDLGASPGGWTHLLANNGVAVVAVDPANLDERVNRMKNVKHFKETSQIFVAHYNDKFDMVVNDMKMFGDKSAHIVCNCSKNFNTCAVLVMTIKLAEQMLWEQIASALDILKEHFEILGVKKLFHNRQEVTVVGKFKK